MFASRTLRRIDAAIMPRCCVFCGETSIGDEGHVCGGCLGDLPYREDPVESEPPFEALVAPLEYSFPIDAAIKAMKFRRKLYYGPGFGEILCGVLDRLPSDIDALLPVPLHWRRQLLRGFNQSEELCKPLRRDSGLVVSRVVRRRRATPFQSGLPAAERRKNLKSAFRLAGRIRCRHPVIVDDVITTGETAAAIAHVLLDGGADKVSVLAIARAVPD